MGPQLSSRPLIIYRRLAHFQESSRCSRTPGHLAFPFLDDLIVETTTNSLCPKALAACKHTT